MRRGRLSRILVSCGMTMLILTSCYYFAIPARRDPSVVTRDLLLDETALPAGWSAGDLYTIRPGTAGYEGDEALVVEFRGPRLPEGQDGAYHSIFRFKNATLATNAYKRMQGDILFFGEAEDNNRHPENWQYRSPNADGWRFACADHGCGVIAQYDEFISVFSTAMTTPSMTPAALEHALKAIDQRMAEKLSKKPAATPTSNPN